MKNDEVGGARSKNNLPINRTQQLAGTTNLSKNILPVKSINFLNKKNPLPKDDEESPLKNKREARGSPNLNVTNLKNHGLSMGFKSAISKIKIVKKKSQSPESAGAMSSCSRGPVMSFKVNLN